jgi:acetyltransferase-like isoleucine patch superfamily enzyme
MFLFEIINKFKFWYKTDRIGPDILFTYWRIFFKSKMLKLCKRKFLFFDESSEIRPGAFVVGCSQISIGKRIIIRPGTMLHGESKSLDTTIIIEDDVLIGCGVHIYVENHEFNNPNLLISEQGHSQAKQVLIKKGSWIGANVIILPGVIIGKNSVIGAGSVVTKSIDDNVIAAGNPARVIRKICNLPKEY